MKKLTINKENECMACLACERACSELFYKTFDPRLSCIKIKQKGDAYIPAVCVQCGKCAKVCEAEAITQNAKGVYMLDKKKCTGCGKCVENCPFEVIVKPESQSAPSKCISCGACVKVCPVDAIFIKES